MFADMENAKIIKQGVCSYDNYREYKVVIVEWHTLYGSGDYEDPPEIANDRAITCFYVWYENLLKKGTFNAGGGGFLSIDEAVCSVENTVSVKWQEEVMANSKSDIIAAHKYSINNRQMLANDKLCGCFHCLAIYDPQLIEEWVKDAVGTALCPFCGIDSVIGESSGFPLTKEFLGKMEKHWF